MNEFSSPAAALGLECLFPTCLAVVRRRRNGRVHDRGRRRVHPGKSSLIRVNPGKSGQKKFRSVAVAGHSQQPTAVAFLSQRTGSGSLPCPRALHPGGTPQTWGMSSISRVRSQQRPHGLQLPEIPALPPIKDFLCPGTRATSNLAAPGDRHPPGSRYDQSILPGFPFDFAAHNGEAGGAIDTAGGRAGRKLKSDQFKQTHL